MNRLHLLTSLLVLLIVTSCSNDDQSDLSAEVNKKYIKAVRKPDLTEVNRDHFFEYNHGLLTVASGYTPLVGSYEYDADGKLVSKVNYKGQFTYEYDDQGRIIKENRIGTNDYIELIYQPSKVITKRYYEFGGGPGNGGGSNLEERELELDRQGRIIKMTDLAQDQSAVDVEYKEFVYDTHGNITQIITKRLDEPTASVINLSYDDKVNPYYIAFEKYYQQTYYLENFAGMTLFNWYGFTPNNIISRATESRTFVYDDENYPISWQRFFVDGTANAEAFVEYY